MAPCALPCVGLGLAVWAGAGLCSTTDPVPAAGVAGAGGCWRKYNAPPATPRTVKSAQAAIHFQLPLLGAAACWCAPKSGVLEAAAVDDCEMPPVNDPKDGEERGASAGASDSSSTGNESKISLDAAM